MRIVGSREGEGRVEMLYRGMWGTICSGDWGIEEAEVVCNSLGFSGAFAKDFSKKDNFYSEGAIWFGNFQCNGKESSLQDCKRNIFYIWSYCNYGYYAGVICNKGLRLRDEGKDSPGLYQDLSGTLEVYYNNSWGVVCSKTWDMNSAQVACRELGLPNVVESLTRVSALSVPDVKFWSASFHCNGSETALPQCMNSLLETNPCQEGKEVQLHCNIAFNATVRLFGGTTNKEGAVELFSNGLWGAFCYENWDDNMASVVCRQLGFTGVIRSSRDSFHYNGRPVPVSWQTNITCQGDESELKKCKVDGFRLSACDGHVSLKCQPDIRISGIVNSINGALELSHKEKWFPVCGDVWDLAAGSVACQHLDYPTAINVSAKDIQVFSKKESWIAITCSGKEDSLNRCQKQIISRSKCSKVAIVKCDPGIRLAGSSKPNEGRVEIFSRGSWGTICDDGFDMIDANVICKGLGYVGASTKKVKINQKADPSMKIHIDTLHCDLSDYFWQCSRYSLGQGVCSHEEDISVSCISVILGDSPLSNEGRLGILNSGILSPAIPNNHNNQVAEVACRELGFPGALSYYVTRSNEVSSLRNIACQGDEHYISECEQTDNRNHSVKSPNVLGVICESQIRLLGLDKPNEGRVEMYFEGAWGTVCDDNWDVNNMNGKVACQQIGYPDVLNNSESFYAPPGIVPNSLDEVNCKGNERNLFECPHIRGQDSDCDNSEDVGIECKTEQPGQPIIVATTNGSSASFDIFIKPPKYPGHLKNFYMYPKVVMNDNDEPVHSAVNRHTFFRHSRNLNVKTSGYYYLYNISVTLENDVGEGGETWVLLRTEENVPSAPNFSTETVGHLSDSINVTWEKPANPNGVITGYIVNWQRHDEKITVSGKATILNGRINQYLITHLRPNSSYRVQISAITSKGQGKSSFLVMRTSIRGPETKPTSSQSNTEAAESSSSSEKISTALAITFGVILFLVAVFLILAKTSILKKFSSRHYNLDGDEHALEFENDAFDLPAASND